MSTSGKAIDVYTDNRINSILDNVVAKKNYGYYEMLKEFNYLGDRAKEIVIDNPNKIADMVEDNIRPVPKGNYPPSIPGAEEKLTEK